MWRKLLVIGLPFVVLIGTATPALAAPAKSASACPFSSTLCLFEGANFTGQRFTVSSLVSPGTCVSLVSHGWGDRAHSAINTNSKGAAMFMNDNCVGGPFQIPANSQLANFGGFTPESVWVAK